MVSEREADVNGGAETVTQPLPWLMFRHIPESVEVRGEALVEKRYKAVDLLPQLKDT